MHLLSCRGLPRTNPIPKEDAQIAERIKSERRAWKVSRTFVADRCQTTSDDIARIELGRVPLRYGIAKQILRYFNLNPTWLMSGHGERRGYVPLPDASVLGTSENALFSEVFNQHLRKLLAGNPKEEAESESSAYTRYVTAIIRCEDIKLWFREVPDGYVLKLDEVIKTVGAEILKKWPADSWERIIERRSMFDQISRWADDFEISKTSPQSSGKQNNLTNTSLKSNSDGVKSELEKLIARVKRLAAKPGVKTELARVLKVAPARVSEWLTDDAKKRKEPGGYYTLELLKWVEQQERQK